MKKRKPRRLQQARLYLPVTNGDVEEFMAAGYEPVLRWVRSEHVLRERPRLFRSNEVRAKLSEAADRPPRAREK